MGILPLEFEAGKTAESLGLTGSESFDIEGLDEILRKGAGATVKADGKTFSVRVRIDTPKELDYYRHGGILQYVLRQLV